MDRGQHERARSGTVCYKLGHGLHVFLCLPGQTWQDILMRAIAGGKGQDGLESFLYCGQLIIDRPHGQYAGRRNKK